MKKYRLTRGHHWAKDPKRPGKMSRVEVGGVIELSDQAAIGFADRIEPMGGRSSVSAPRVAKEGPTEINATAGAISLAATEGVDLEYLEGTGRGGKITKGDVEEAIAASAGESSAASASE